MLYILLRSVPRCHEPDFIFCLVPVIEESGLREAVGDRARELEQQDVAVGALGKNVTEEIGDALTELLCLRVGVGGVLLP